MMCRFQDLMFHSLNAFNVGQWRWTWEDYKIILRPRRSIGRYWKISEWTDASVHLTKMLGRMSDLLWVHRFRCSAFVASVDARMRSSIQTSEQPVVFRHPFQKRKDVRVESNWGACRYSHWLSGILQRLLWRCRPKRSCRGSKFIKRSRLMNYEIQWHCSEI